MCALKDTNELNSILKAWSQRSTIHPVPKISHTKNVFLKFLWTCCFIASTIYCIYSISLNLNDFFMHSTYISSQIIDEIPCDFPAVTLCSLKHFNKTAIKNYLNDEIDLNWNNITQKSQSVIELYALMYIIKLSIDENNTLNETYKQSLRYQLQNILISCYYNHQVCSMEDFKYFYDKLIGNCYTFNSGVASNGTKTDIKQSPQAGFEYGLTIEIFVGNPDIETLYEYNDGLIISIHNQSRQPNLNSDRIYVSVGSETDIKISRRSISKLSYPYSNCFDHESKNSKFDSEFIDFIVNKKGIKYSQEFCYTVCLQKQIIKICNCSEALYSLYDNIRLCSSIADYTCIENILKNTYKKEISLECVKGCPTECHTINYNVAISAAKYPTKFYQKTLKNHPIINQSGILIEDIKDAVLKVNVFYESTKHVIEQEKATINTQTLISNIGGTLGVFLGMSIISFIEIFEFIVEIMLSFTKRFSIFKLRNKNLDNSV